MTPQIRVHYWYVWGQVAIDHEREAVARRPEWLRAFQTTGDPDLSPERNASVVAIAASAFAVDAWYGEVTPLIPGDDKRRTRRGEGNRNGIIVEALKLGFDLGPKTHTWQREMDWLFKEQRDGLVHPLTEFEDVATLTEGLQGSPSHIRHSALTATRAVDLMLDVLQTCAARPRAGRAELAGYVTHFRPTIDDLCSLRSPSAGQG